MRDFLDLLAEHDLSPNQPTNDHPNNEGDNVPFPFRLRANPPQEAPPTPPPPPLRPMTPRQQVRLQNLKESDLSMMPDDTKTALAALGLLLGRSALVVSLEMERLGLALVTTTPAWRALLNQAISVAQLCEQMNYPLRFVVTDDTPTPTPEKEG